MNIMILRSALKRFYCELSEHFPNLNVDDEIFEAMEEAGTLNTAVPETTFEVVFFNFSVWHLFLFVHSPFILFW